MKTLATVILSASLGFGAVATAEPFTDRGHEFIATVQSDTGTVRSAVTVTESGFNDRGQDYIADAPAGSAAQKPMISRHNDTKRGWNS